MVMLLSSVLSDQSRSFLSVHHCHRFPASRWRRPHGSAQVRLLIAVGIVLEQGDSQVAGDRAHLAVLDEPRLGSVLFGPLQGLNDRFAVGFDEPFITADKGEDRPTLRHGEGEVQFPAR